MALGVYRRRQPERTALFRVVNENLRTFQALTEDSGRPLPRYVWQEFEKYLACGVLSRGFARVFCPACRYDRLVAFSCKTRSWCPSCLGRFMNETASYLADHVIGDLPVRHWVCTVPPPLRYLLAHDIELCNEVVAAFSSAVFRWLRHEAQQELGLASVREAHPAAVTVLHRASSHLALNVHFHSIAADGVWLQSSPSALPVFRALPSPCRGDMRSVAWEVCTRTLAMLRRRGLWLDVDPSEDPFGTAEPGLAFCQSASVAGVLTVGPHAGQRVLRIGAMAGGVDPDASADEPFSPQGVTPGYGFSVHAARRVAGHDRAGLLRLARYVTRPPLAQDRLKLLPDGDVLLELKRVWSDGTRAIRFEPLDFLAKLAALVFPPCTHRIRYQGVWARRSKLRPLVTPRPEEEGSSDAGGSSPACAQLPDAGGSSPACAHDGSGDPRRSPALAPASPALASPAPASPAPASPAPASPALARSAPAPARAPATAEPAPAWHRPRYDWARLLARVFSVDVLECPRCQAHMQRIAWVTRHDAILAILESVGLPADSPEPAPARRAAQAELFASG